MTKLQHTKKKQILRLRRKWKRIAMILSVFVVISTLYGLSLPADTMSTLHCTQQEHVHDASCYRQEENLVCGLEDHEHTAECYQEDSVLTCQTEEHSHQAQCYTVENTETVIAEELTYPAHTFEQETEGIKVTVTAQEGSLPSDTTMKIERIDAQEVLSCALEKVGTEDARAVAVDISFLNGNGEEIEPRNEVLVTIKTDEIANTNDVTVVHMKEEEPAIVAQEKNQDLREEERPEADEVVFSSDTFSTYVLVYTVDFSYGAYTYSIAGESQILLSQLLDVLHVNKEDGNILSVWDIQSVQFSDESLVGVQQIENDWLLESFQPFSSEETLTLTLYDTDVLTIMVTDAQGIDFGQYITDIVTERIDNNQWRESESFLHGDGMKVEISYELPAHLLQAVSEEERTITYVLPDGVFLDHPETGEMQDENGKHIGTYIVGTDGEIDITFDADYIEAHTGVIAGEIHFSAIASNLSTEIQKTVTFGGAVNKTITITSESNEDIHTKKTGSILEDNTLSYQIVTSSINGTGETPITITDSFDAYSGYGYEAVAYSGQLSVVKISADGTQTQIWGYDVQYTDNYTGFTLTNLPALGAGESYITTYTATLTNPEDVFKVVNNVDSNGSHTQNTLERKKIVEKNGWYDKDTNLITWTITANPDRLDVTEWTLTDTSPYEIVSDVMVTGDRNGYTDTFTTDGTTINYTFHNLTEEQKTDCYTLTYQTKAPQEDGTVENTVTGQKPDGSQPQSATGTVDVVHRQEGVKKEYRNETDTYDQGFVTYSWSADAIMPTEAVTKYVYTDTIANAVNAITGADLGADSHYAIAARLEESFKQRLYVLAENGSKYIYNGDGEVYLDWNQENTTDAVTFAVTYYDAGGNVVSAADETTKVKSFKIEVSFKEGEEIVGSKLHLDEYHTYADTSERSAGDVFRVTNTGTVGNHASIVDHISKVPSKLIKSVMSDSINGTFTETSADVQYNEIGNGLTYRLALHVSATDTEIDVRDLLPAGTSYVEGSLTGGFRSLTNEDIQTQNWAENNADFENPEWFNSHVSVTYDDNSRQLQVQIHDLGYSQYYDVLVLTYQVSIEGDSDWKDILREEKTYTNTAVWGDYSASQITNVKREVQTLEKDGEQVLDENGNPTNTLHYKLTINPKGDDLDPDSDSLSLNDTFDLNGGWNDKGQTIVVRASDFNPSLDITSVKLYSIDSTKEDNIGEEISHDLYTVAYDIQKAELEITLPDETPCILVYDYHVAMTFANEVIFGNEAVLNDTWITVELTHAKAQESGASAHSQTITIYKVDQENYAKRLPNAVFTLQKWDKENNQWVVVYEDLRTDGDGKIHWDLNVDLQEIQENTLYRLYETQAPENYAKSDKSYYFVYLNSNDEEEAAKTQSGVSEDEFAIRASDEAFLWEDVLKFKHSGDSYMYVPNKSTVITVKKIWTDEKGVVLDSPPGAVQVALYRQVSLPEYYTVDLTVRVKAGDTYQEKVFDTIQVQKNSALTIQTGTWFNPTEVTAVCDKASVVINQLESSKEFVVESVEENLKIVITQNDPEYYGGDYYVMDYTQPDSVLQEAQKIQEITLSAENGWIYTESLPSTDENGNPYYYTIVEETQYQGYTTTYLNNDGIQHGQITVNNQKGKNSGFELPQTGGTGIVGQMGGGLSLMALAVYLQYRKKKCKEVNDA